MRLGLWHFSIIITVLAAVSLTGLAWFVRHDLVESEPDDLQRLLLAAHGVFAYGAVLVFGSALPTHARLAWRHKRNIASGLSMIVTIGTLALTALWLYYGNEESRNLARWVHIGVGLAVFAAVPIHIMLGRRIRQADAIGFRQSQIFTDNASNRSAA
jgi:hypothetical protein